MPTPADLQQARRTYEDALFSGCSAEVTTPLGRELARLENEADPSLKARRLRTAAVDKLAAAERYTISALAEVGASRFRSAALDLRCASECIGQAGALRAEADGVEGSALRASAQKAA